MRLKYRDNMSPEELAAFMGEIERQEQVFADVAARDAELAASLPPGDDEDYECFDPVRDGWVDRNTGRP